MYSGFTRQDLLTFWGDVSGGSPLHGDLINDNSFADYHGDLSMSGLLANMAHYGALTLPAVVDAEMTGRMLATIEDVRRAGYHEVFALVFDDFWRAVWSLADSVTSILGPDYRVVPLPLVNYVAAGAAGFTPHRDRWDDPIAADGSPNMMTIWFAVTDAGANRGCLTVLPTCNDLNFPEALRKLELRDVRNALPLPVRSGDVILFNQATMHWGNRNYTDEPRVSFAIELERASAPVPRHPYIDPQSSLSIEERCGFIGAVVEGLALNNVNFTPRDLSLAESMLQGFYGSETSSFWSKSLT